MATHPRTKVGLVWDSWRAYRGGAPTIHTRQQARLAEMIAHARSNSPYYRELYRDLPAHIDSLQELPPTSKTQLMQRFDEWSVDRDVRLTTARAFVADTKRIGDYYLEKYTLLTTSGTTGDRGIFALDNRTMAVTNAMALRMLSQWLGAADALRVVRGGARMAMAMAGGGHFASVVAAERLKRKLASRVAVLSVRQPLPELVQHLNTFQPTVLAAYASLAALLANEQDAGRLNIAPVLIALAAEGLRPREYARISHAFSAHVGNSYAATECPFLSFSCSKGWLHVNADWVAVEPVDADHKPVAPGVPSHTVLITNLANRVQPLVRYDLGDSVVQKVGPCECGSPLPAIQVVGRSGEMLAFHTRGGDLVQIPPLAFATLADAIPGLQQTQFAQLSPTALAVRVRASGDAEIIWAQLHAALMRLMQGYNLDNIAIARSPEPPIVSAGGKYRAVIPLR